MNAESEKEKPENLENVMRRISKLLAISSDDRANPAEAASAASMAERIMRKYQLEHADIIISKLKAGEDMDEVDFHTRSANVPLWLSTIAVKVSRMNDCNLSVGMNAKGKAFIKFGGFKSDTQVAKYSFEYLVSTVNRLCKEFTKKIPARYVWAVSG